MKRWSWLPLIVLLTISLLFGPQSIKHPQPALAVIPDKMVTLTFDDGPDPRFTPAILKLLNEHHVKATFFAVGQNILAHPDLARQIVREGHAIANHTLTHPHLEKLSEPQVRAELAGGDAALTSVLGPAQPVPHYFRPPRGNVSPEIERAAVAMQKEIVLWNVCVENSSTSTPEQVRARVDRLIDERDGGILLAHDGVLDRSLTVQSLPLILQDLEQKGYRIVPLDEYLASRHAKASRE